MSEASQSLAMRRLSQAQRILTYIAIAFAAIAAAYLLFTLLSEHEVCYGMQSDKLLCQPVDAVAAARGALVLLFPGILFVGLRGGRPLASPRHHARRPQHSLWPASSPASSC